MVAPSPSSPDELLSGMILSPSKKIMSLTNSEQPLAVKMSEEAAAARWPSQVKCPVESVESLKSSIMSHRCPAQPSQQHEEPLPFSRSARSQRNATNLRRWAPEQHVKSPPRPVAEGRCEATSSWAPPVYLKSSDASPQPFEYHSKATLPRMIMEQLSVQVKRKLTLANNGQGAKSANQMGPARASMSAPMHQAPAPHKLWPHLQPDSVAGRWATKSGQLNSSHLRKLW